MKKGLIILSILLVVTLLLTFTYVKTQSEQIRYYKTSFFSGAQDLIENYQFILDFEKSYLKEQNSDKKKQMLENHINLLSLSENHSDSVKALLYKQVNIDEFVELESKVRMEAGLFQSSSSDSQKQIHAKNLDEAIAKFNKFLDDGMKTNDVCLSGSC
ncbi:hypothetical protein MHB65_13460 [Lysinibacillus sp. FSL K6-0075]|uniref:hypothetical protein n=1 Tax=Lysinibacillus sp. FSL K6-0075 TaxID=2921415 RepID=UPI003158A64D